MTPVEKVVLDNVTFCSPGDISGEGGSLLIMSHLVLPVEVSGEGGS